MLYNSFVLFCACHIIFEFLFYIVFISGNSGLYLHHLINLLFWRCFCFIQGKTSAKLIIVWK